VVLNQPAGMPYCVGVKFALPHQGRTSAELVGEWGGENI
jgi:hypothetical protein